MDTNLYILNSFSKNEAGGNPAGVVLSLDFEEDEMKAIASKAGFSETAFLKKIDETTYKIRFFTPEDEVDLCGHATIAAFSLLKKQNMVKGGIYKLQTKARDIEIFIDDIITMTQKLPEYSEIIEFDEIKDCFINLNKEDLIENMPARVVSTGLRDIILPVKSLNTLLNLKPNFEKMALLSSKYSTIGLHAFSLETKNAFNTAHARNFAPLYGIPEESATGTANGALSCYLFKYFNNGLDFSNLVFEQGDIMNAPSEIYANLEINEDEIKCVKVGGRAVFKAKIAIS